ncbi:hypothetical protein [Streptomyces sp. NPDC102487]|uniref:hypothetical protein n=1 Tax=Streptomyces sp. NPDC102487 TaxID=3366182 RepID=UPI00381EAA03
MALRTHCPIRAPDTTGDAHAPTEDENTPATPEPGDADDDTETYLSSYEPQANSLSTSTLTAELATTADEKLAAAYTRLHGRSQKPPPKTYRYIGSYTKLR